MKKISLGFVVSILFFLTSLTWLCYTATMPFSSSVTSFGGPATFPFIVLCIMTAGAGFVTMGEFFKMRQGGGVLFPDNMSIMRIVSLFVTAVIYVIIVEFVGYVPATALLILAALLLFGVRNKLVLVLVTTVFPASIYLLFQVLLQVQLP